MPLVPEEPDVPLVPEVPLEPADVAPTNNQLLISVTSDASVKT